MWHKYVLYDKWHSMLENKDYGGENTVGKI